MNPEDMKFCQSCGMPMSDEHFASEKDGSEEMIDYSAPKAAEVTGMSEDEARKMCAEMFPKLKRWMK